MQVLCKIPGEDATVYRMGSMELGLGNGFSGPFLCMLLRRGYGRKSFLFTLYRPLLVGCPEAKLWGHSISV